MNALERMFAHTPPADAPPAAGRWFAIRLAPDPASGELLNIGIGYIGKGRRLHFKLLQDTTALRCLYGRKASGNFGFLLRVLEEQLARGGKPVSPSPQIRFGPMAYAAGADPQMIVEEMFARLVPLAGPAQDDDDEDVPQGRAILDTPTLRKRVVTRLRKAAPGYAAFWRNESIPVRHAKTVHHLDMQIWKGDDLLDPAVYGMVISLQYKSDFYRRGALDGSFRHMSIAHDYLAKRGKGFILMLKPAVSADYPEALQRTMDQEIEETVWPLRKKHIEPITVASVPALTDTLLAAVGS